MGDGFIAFMLYARSEACKKTSSQISVGAKGFLSELDYIVGRFPPLVHPHIATDDGRLLVGGCQA